MKIGLKIIQVITGLFLCYTLFVICPVNFFIDKEKFVGPFILVIIQTIIVLSISLVLNIIKEKEKKQENNGMIKENSI